MNPFDQSVSEISHLRRVGAFGRGQAAYLDQPQPTMHSVSIWICDLIIKLFEHPALGSLLLLLK